MASILRHTGSHAKAIKQKLDGHKSIGLLFQIADCRKTFEEFKAKGVEFVSEPKDQFYGVEAVFKKIRQAAALAAGATSWGTVFSA